MICDVCCFVDAVLCWCWSVGGSPQMPQCYFAMLVALVVSSQALTGLFGLSFCTSVLSLFYQLLSIPNTIAPNLYTIACQYLLNHLLLLFSVFDSYFLFVLWCDYPEGLLSLESHEWLLARINFD